MIAHHTPPHDIEAEESQLSGMILHRNIISDTLDILNPEDFYKTAHKVIFKAIRELYLEDAPVDIITLKDRLTRNECLEQIGGIENLVRFLDQIPGAVNATQYCKIIKDKANLRRLIESSHLIIQNAMEAKEDAAQIIDKAQQAIMTLDGSVLDSPFITMSELTEQSMERYENLKNGDNCGSVRTGYKKLDQITGGFKKSKLIIVAARPAIGKTSFMRNLASNMAKLGHTVGIIALEPDADELDDGWFSQETGINSAKLSYGKNLDSDDWIKLTQVASIKAEWPIMIKDSWSMLISQVKRTARKMVKAGCECIMVDQLSGIRSDNKKHDVFQANTNNVEQLAFLKKELKIPIVLLAQLNRELEKRMNKKPILSDLKNTGMLEEAADIVILGYRKHVYTKADEDINHAEWEIVKHRGGPNYNINMHWKPKTMCFLEQPEQWHGG